MEKVKELLSRITAECMGIVFIILVKYDDKYTDKSALNVPYNGRLYIQVEYSTICTHSQELGTWKGRKYYLSNYMTDDEVIKTAYVAFKQAVEHEVMEGFKVDNIILFNPHINFEELLKVSHKEVKRKDNSSPLKVIHRKK